MICYYAKLEDTSRQTVHAFECNLTEPAEGALLNRLKFPGIKSCTGCTYLADAKRIVNHLFPDVADRSIGLRGFTVESGPYPMYKDTGNVLSGKYKVFSKDELTLDVSLAQFRQRQRWLELIYMQEEFDVVFPIAAGKKKSIVGTRVQKKAHNIRFACTVLQVAESQESHQRHPAHTRVLLKKDDLSSNVCTAFEFTAGEVKRRLDVDSRSASEYNHGTTIPVDISKWSGKKFIYYGTLTYIGVVYDRVDTDDGKRYACKFEDGSEEYWTAAEVRNHNLSPCGIPDI